MTNTELRKARATLNLSAAELARALQLGAHGGRTVRRWEAGERPVPGPVSVVVQMLLREQVTSPRYNSLSSAPVIV